MKKIVLAIFLIVAVACEQNKIGFVDNVKLMDGYQEKIDIEARYKIRAETLNKKRDSISQAFQIEAQAFQIKAQSMPETQAQEEYGALQQRGQFIGQQLQQEEQQMQSEGQIEMDSLIGKVKMEINGYGKSNGFTYILSGGDGGSVLYGTDTKDLTQDILKILNEQYKN